MPQQQLYTAILVNQWYSDKVIKFPFRWNPQKHFWYMQEAKAGLYWKSVIPLKLHAMMAYLVIYSLGLTIPKLYDYHELVVQFFTLGVLFMAITADISSYTFGRTILSCWNWSDKSCQKWMTKQAYRKMDKWVGSFALLGVIWYTTFSITVSIGVVFMNLDPFYFFYKLLLHFGFNFLSFESLAMLVFRYVVVVIAAQVLVVSFRMIVLVYMTQGIYRIALLRLIMEDHSYPTYIACSFYKENQIVMEKISKFDRIATVLGFANVYVFFQFAVNIAVIGSKTGNYLLAAVAIPCIVVPGTCLHLIYKMGCPLFEMSTSILEMWKFEAEKMRDGKKIAKIVASLQPIAMGIGEVGILDYDIKCDFLDRMLQSIADVAVATSQVLK